MFRTLRHLTLAFAAVATLATATLVTTDDASARPGFRMGGPSLGRIHAGPRLVGRPNFVRPIIHRPHFRPHFRPHWHRCGWHRPCFVRWHRPYVYAAPVAAVTTYAAAPTYNRCTCLTKEYTPDGLVVFKDVCTKEIATAPVGTPGTPGPQTQLEEPAPQSPTAQGPATLQQPQVR
jgi:hypothetical protein